MWFKNAYIYQLTRSQYFEQIDLPNLIKSGVFIPCGKTEMTKFGFVSALPGTENLVHGFNNDFMLLRVQREEKVIVPDAITRPLNERVKIIEENELRGVSKREKEQIKEEIIFELLPHAQSRYKNTHFYIDVKRGLIVIDSANSGAAEDVLSLMRKCIGTLPITCFFMTGKLQDTLKDWISTPNNIPEKIKVGYELKISGLGDEATQATFINQDLYDETLQSFMNDFQHDVKQLNVEFDDMLSVTLKDDGSLRKIKYFDVLMDKNEEIDSDDLLARIDADLVLFTGEFGRFLDSFIDINVVEKVDVQVFDATSINEKLIELKKQIGKIPMEVGKIEVCNA
jgi:recombination associated protein RdgC